jgi:hypothetical protein
MDYESNATYTGDDVVQWLSDRESAEDPLVKTFLRYLTIQETAQIIRQFQTHWIQNGQVLWSGMPREATQKWADQHHLQTLTTAMGLLMRIEHTSCLRSKMSQRHWSQYVHGASAIFAWFISRGELVTVLSPPPPERFHLSGHTSYQEIEEPIVTGQVGQSAVAQIIIVHPTIKGGEEFFYELWPVDRGSTWVENFGLQSATRRWRRTRQCDDRRLRELAALRDQSPGQPKPSGGCSDFFKDRKVRSGNLFIDFYPQNL